MLSTIKMVPPPFETPMIEVKQFWHRRFQNDARSMWYRGLLMSIFRNAQFKASEGVTSRSQVNSHGRQQLLPHMVIKNRQSARC
jgi:hypothetical protein